MGKSLFRPLVAFAAVLLVGTISAQPARAWTRIVGLNNSSNTETAIVRTDANGNTYWAKRRTQRGVAEQVGYLELTKVNPIGGSVWTINLVAAGSGATVLLGMVLDSSGNPILAEYDFVNFLTGQGPILTKLSSSNGAKVWSVASPQSPNFTSFSMAVDPSNNIYLGGTGALQGGDQRMGVTRHSGASGAVLWSKTVTRTASNFADTFSDLATDASGNVIVVGTTRVDNPCNFNNPAAIVMGKLRASDGLVLWTQTYTAAASDINRNPMVRVDQSNNVLIGATAVRTGLDAWILLKRAYATGNALYSRVFQLAGFDQGTMSDFQKDSTGGVAAAGDAGDATSDGVLVVRLSNLGAISWTRMLRDRQVGQSGPFGARTTRMSIFGSSSVLVAYTRVTSPSRPTSLVIANRLNVSNGNTVWERLFNGAASSETDAVSAALTPNGDFVVGSAVETDSDNDPTLQPGLARFKASDGAFAFTLIGGNAVLGSADFGADATIDSSGNTYGTGSSAGRIVTLKYNSAGTVLWQNNYDDPGVDDTSFIEDGGRLIVKDLGNNVIVAGVNRGIVVLQKISGSTGGTIWTKKFGGQLGRSLAVDVNGNVFVPFTSPPQVLKLSAGAGTVLWTGVVNGPRTFDRADYVTVDGFGNAFVSGVTYENPICPNPRAERILVTKINGTNGSQMWAKEVAAPVAGANYPTGIALDSGGAVLVAGTSVGTGGLDLVTCKMFSSNGDALWTTRHDDAGKENMAVAMTVDGSGNLVVAGTSATNGWTIKVFGSNGSRAWANTLSVPAGNKLPTDIARDASNNIYVVGYNSNGVVPQQYGQKILTGTGATAWTVTLANATTAGQKVSAEVNNNNRLHIFGSVTSQDLSLSNIQMVQFNP